MLFCVNFIILIICPPNLLNTSCTLRAHIRAALTTALHRPCDCVSVIFVYCVCPKNRPSIASLSLSRTPANANRHKMYAALKINIHFRFGGSPYFDVLSYFRMLYFLLRKIVLIARKPKTILS